MLYTYNKTNMNYKTATISKTFKYSSQAKNNLAYKLSTVPKGWIYIQKNGTIHHTLSKNEQEMFDNYLMQKKLLHTNEKFFNRYVQRKAFQMERDGYNEDDPSSAESRQSEKEKSKGQTTKPGDDLHR